MIYKPKWSFVDFKSIEGLVKVLEWGNSNHKDNSDKGWRDGTGYRYSPKGILESITRHTMAMLDGEEHDPESGLSHMDHIQANTMFYNYFKRKQNEEITTNNSNTYIPDRVYSFPEITKSSEVDRTSKGKRCQCEKGYHNKDRECECTGPKDCSGNSGESNP